MTDRHTAAAKAKVAKHTASPFGLPNYEMPNFDLPNMKVPEAFRELAEHQPGLMARMSALSSLMS
jgi:hypothetical protein